MKSSEMGPSQEELEESVERKEGETPMEHFERLRRLSGVDKAKIEKEDADSAAVDKEKRKMSA